MSTLLGFGRRTKGVNIFQIGFRGIIIFATTIVLVRLSTDLWSLKSQGRAGTRSSSADEAWSQIARAAASKASGLNGIIPSTPR
jgi:hypothetical protein